MKYNTEDEIKARAYRIIAQLPDFNFNFYIAGNCLNSPNAKDIHDVDLFPVGGNNFPDNFPEGCELICKTKNAYTLEHKGLKIQLCNYKYMALEELVNSFDYAHIQVGVEVKNSTVNNVYHSQDWLTSNSLHTSWYTGSDYPLSSAIRALKYYQYGQITHSKAIFSIISALTDVIDRGFDSYEDFKDQIDAVDLGLVADNENEFSDLDRLFELLDKGK